MALSPEQDDRNKLIKDRMAELKGIRAQQRQVFKDMGSQHSGGDLVDLIEEQLEHLEDDDTIQGSFE